MSTTVINPNSKPQTRKLGATPDPLAEMAKRIRELEEANAALKAKNGAGGVITFKVSQSGCVSAYGLGRYPATYRAMTKDGQLWAGSQWERLITACGGDGAKLKAFVEANAAAIRKATAEHNAKAKSGAVTADDESAL